MRPLPPDPLSLIERPPAERQAAEALGATDPAGAASTEARELVESLEAIPAALRTLPWRQERLWPAVRAGLQRRPAVARGWRWTTWVSLASLFVIFSGAWWGSVSNAASLATRETRSVAQPPATVQWELTPSLVEGVQRAQLRQTPLSGKTSLPLPAPAQTPIFSGAVFTGTVAPGS
jgi:hypothetical protein